MMNRSLASAVGIFVLSNFLAVPVPAHPLTLAECNEGGEFIRNAALARDNGITREMFVDRLLEDLMVIQSFPPQLRWFVQDSSDERLLTDAVYRVFDDPMKAELHESSFVGTCLLTAEAGDGTRI